MTAVTTMISNEQGAHAEWVCWSESERDGARFKRSIEKVIQLQMQKSFLEFSIYFETSWPHVKDASEREPWVRLLQVSQSGKPGFWILSLRASLGDSLRVGERK